MRCFTSASIIGLSLALAGCSDDTEQAPDITEAIPLDEEAGVNETAQDPADYGEADNRMSGGQSTEDTGTSNLPGDGSSTGERALPGSMERGANPPTMTQPPAGSKVQPADG